MHHAEISNSIKRAAYKNPFHMQASKERALQHTVFEVSRATEITPRE